LIEAQKRPVQQALQSQTFQKYGNNKNSKKNGKGKGNWSNNGKAKIDDIVEYSKKGRGSDNNHSKKKDFDKNKVQCYNCEKFGHFANECFL
jgi:hypothetical protein